MSKKSAAGFIRLRGVRHNNLKNFDLDLPLNRLIVVTGLSGSGKSSLAFDTLFAEGQRRYIETFSPYARQFFDRMDKPQVDSITGIPPAIAIEQRNSVKSTRSTVGTMTEICDYMKLVWPHLARLHCRQCGKPVHKEPPQFIWESLQTSAPLQECLITFEVPVSEKLSLDETLGLIARQGYQRIFLNGEILRLEEAAPLLAKNPAPLLAIVQDRVKIVPASRARFVEACEQALHFGKGKISIHPLNAAADKPATTFLPPLKFSNRLHCAACDIEYTEPSAALFSFNHPLGACPACRGFGRVINIDYDLALPDRSKTLADGAVRPWQTGVSAECQDDLKKFCRIRNVPMNVPFTKLSKKHQDWVINGDPDYGKDKKHQWPHAWYGIKGYFRWLESKSYKMHVRVLLSRYRSYQPCPACHATRFQPDSLLYRAGKSSTASSQDNPADGEQLYIARFGNDVRSPRPTTQEWGEGENAQTEPMLGYSSAAGLNLAEFYQLSVGDALEFIKTISTAKNSSKADPFALALNEVRSRLAYLAEVGLGYLTLDRSTRSLSGGETERVNLTTCLGSRLVNTLFVLDEPSVGLHPRDTSRLVTILQRLRDAGNTVVVVEHESSVMRAANQIVDIGPGHGSAGGEVVFQGDYSAILDSDNSLTGQYLSNRRSIPVPQRRKVQDQPALELSDVNLHNLRNLSAKIPLGRFVCLTGVSGSGKTTLAREVLLPLLTEKLGRTALEDAAEPGEKSDPDAPEVAGSAPRAEISNWESLGRVVMVDQSTLGKTPRSNPAVYIGAFEDIREVFAASERAAQLGMGASAFSFNSAQGQCEHCRGAGFEKIEMQFLSDVFIRCPECNGRRYRPHILEIKISPPTPAGSKIKPAWSIADMLDATVDEAVSFLSLLEPTRHAKRACEALKLLQETGLGYLKLGQPINTLSGGESQRLKLVRHLAEFTTQSAGDTKPTLFMFDEPTTGLHFDDVRVLLNVFQRIVDAGHSLLIIEHNLEVIKSADWVIDLGPDAGRDGGKIVAEGTPEQIARCAQSHTGAVLLEVLR
jgi:excinuclease ABC subunit A